LAQNSTFEETVYLLLHGKLPTAKELADFDATLRANRSLPREVLQVIELVKASHPMDVLRTAISALAAFEPDTNDNSQEATLRKGMRLTAQAPTIVTAHDRIRQGKDPVEPNAKLNHAANFLYMLYGKEPDSEEAKLLDLDFVLHAEHGANASAFAARVTASTLADLHCAVTTGVGTLKGPWHGGAAEAVMKMALDIGAPERASDYARGLLESGGRIMGFGHRVYKAEDPRARHMRERSKWLAERKGEPRWFQILTELEQAMQPYAAKGICVNVDFYAGSVYYLLGIAEDLFIPIFAMGRIPGWTLQVLEQFADNILIRPLTEYVGPMDVKYVPLSDRR
jgi:citrate synthase